MASKNKKLVVILVEVNKRPTNEVEGDGWMPSERFVAAEVQDVLGRYDTDDGYVYGMVQVWPYILEDDMQTVIRLLRHYADSREAALLGEEHEAEAVASR